MLGFELLHVSKRDRLLAFHHLACTVNHFSVRCDIVTTLGLIKALSPLCCTILLLAEFVCCLQEWSVYHLNPSLPRYSFTHSINRSTMGHVISLHTKYIPSSYLHQYWPNNCFIVIILKDESMANIYSLSSLYQEYSQISQLLNKSKFENIIHADNSWLIQKWFFNNVTCIVLYWLIYNDNDASGNTDHNDEWRL